MRARPPGWAAGRLAAAGAVAGAVVPALVLDRRRARRSCWSSCSLEARPAAGSPSSPACCWPRRSGRCRSQPLQADTPIVKRARSLEPSKVEENAQDRYRLDELRNVTAEIRRQPVTGLGLGGQWTRDPPARRRARERAQLHARGRALVVDEARHPRPARLPGADGELLAMSWQVWRRSADPLFSAAGLAVLLRRCWRSPSWRRWGRSPAWIRASPRSWGPSAACSRRCAGWRCGRPRRLREQRLGARSATAAGRAAPPPARARRGPRSRARCGVAAVAGQQHARRPRRRGRAWRSRRCPAGSARSRPRPPVATTGRSASIPIEIASGSPSVGEGQKTTTSQPDSSSAGSAPVVGTKWAASPSGAARVRSSASVSPSPIISRCTGGPGCAAPAAPRRRSPPRCASSALKRVRQPIRNASSGMPSSRRWRGAGLGLRPEARRVDRVGDDADAVGRHARLDQRLRGCPRRSPAPPPRRAPRAA